jgi:hypothetical protein
MNKTKTILMALLGASALAAGPALADRGHGRGHGHGHGHAKHHFKHHHHGPAFRGHAHYAPRPVVVVPPPRVLYHAPAPVYHAPVPAYYPASPVYDAGSVSIRLRLPL